MTELELITKRYGATLFVAALNRFGYEIVPIKIYVDFIVYTDGCTLVMK